MINWENMTFAVIGGDVRQTKLCKLLLDMGHTVYAWGFDRCVLDVRTQAVPLVKQACAEADCVILPMPLCREGQMLNAPLTANSMPLSELFADIQAGTLVCAGGINAENKALALKHGLRTVDYLDREDLSVMNAVPTAEGAIQIAMEETEFTIDKSNCLIIGNGRIGKQLSQKLQALGANVSVSARSSADMAKIKAAGHTCLRTDDLDHSLGDFDLIFNTVPHMVLGRAQLRKVKPEVFVIDLASKPGGVDFDGAMELGLHVRWALSLPGKVAPLTSAKIVCDTVFAILEEEKNGKH